MNTGDATTFWKQSYELLLNREEIKSGSGMAKAFLDYLMPASFDEDRFVFSIRLTHAKKWIEDHYLSYIEEAVTSTLGGPRTIIINLVDEMAEQSPAPTDISSDAQAPSKATEDIAEQPSAQLSPPPSIQPVSSQQYISQPETVPSPVSTSYHETTNMNTGLSSVFAPDIQTQESTSSEQDSRFLFSNFVMGDSNELACKTSQRVAEAPGLYFNPLFIFGKSGLGKTHLLLSIKNYINTYLLDKRVVYSPITGFVNDFTNAIAGDRDLTSFKSKYHTCDILLIDDVQYLEGKVGTTDALFEIFNMFIENKKQIVLSADRSPSEINLDERFTSRFAQGITVDIQPPNFEMKTAILKHYKRYYCDFLNISEIDFSDEAIQKIVELSGSNIRELEGAVSNLIVSFSCKKDGKNSSPVSCDDVEEILGNSFFHKNIRRVDKDMVIRAVESYFKVSRDELLSDKRSKNISHPRQVAMYLIRRYTDMSYPEIGESFNKDHTTVMYADKNIQAKMVKEVTIKTDVDSIHEMLTS